MNPQRINQWIAQLPTEFQRQIGGQYGECVRVEAQAVLFEDSTHRIFKAVFEKNGQPLIVKACLHQTEQAALQSAKLGQRHFWAVMNSLFATPPCATLARSQGVYGWLQRHSVLQIPVFFGACQLDDPTYMSVSFQQFILGESLHNQSVTTATLHNLAKHLLAMHRQNFSGFGEVTRIAEIVVTNRGQAPTEPSDSNFNHTGGTVDKPTSNSAWVSKLAEVLESLPVSLFEPYAKPDFSATLQAIAETSIKFVPQVIDFRWDQLRCSQQEKVFLLDLDALVVAPLELDWVMLELVLTPAQLAGVVAEYQRHLPMPSIAKQRLAYRALLFAMNSLGESDWQAWLNRPRLLD